MGGMCTRRRKVREEKLNEYEDQALVVHTKNGRKKKKDPGSPTSRSLELKKGKSLRRITHPTNVIHVIS